MSRNTKNVSTRKPYCKVCHDAGKPESEYTGHWVKDRDGKTLCPTLLNTECRYCYKLGHTAKFCDILAKNNKEREKAERRQSGIESQSVALKKPVVQKKPQNAFACLCDSDSEEEVSKPNTIVESFPVLGVASNKIEVSIPKVEAEVKTGWAAIVAKPKPVEVPRQTGFVVLSDYIKPAAIESKPVIRPTVFTKSTIAFF